MRVVSHSRSALISVSQLNSAVPFMKRVSHGIINVWIFELVYIMSNTVCRIIKRGRNFQICRKTKRSIRRRIKFYAKYFIISFLSQNHAISKIFDVTMLRKYYVQLDDKNCSTDIESNLSPGMKRISRFL